jgi:hypothetical protein
MLSDASEGFKDTWQFVDNRINDLITTSRFKYEVFYASRLNRVFVNVN